MHATRRTSPARALTLAFALATFLLTACSSVEHVSLLRAEQDRFSEAADVENTATRERLLNPTRASLVKAAQGWDGSSVLATPVGLGDATKLYAQYGEVARTLGILIDEKGGALAQDKLLGTARALQVLAEWREAFYGLYLGALEPEQERGEVKALTAVANDANALLADESLKAQLYPRDAALLALVPGLARFELLVLDVVRTGDGVFNDDRLKTGGAWIEEILVANGELIEAFEASGAKLNHLVDYYLSTRKIFLTTAEAIAVLTNLDQEDPPPATINKLNAQVLLFKSAVQQSSLDAARKPALLDSL